MVEDHYTKGEIKDLINRLLDRANNGSIFDTPRTRRLMRKAAAALGTLAKQIEEKDNG